MFTGAMDQALCRKRRWLRTLIPVGLGAMVLSVLFLLPGCGSDSNPGGPVQGKNEKATASAKAKKMPGAISVLTDQPGEIGKVKKEKEVKMVEAFPGVTRQELEAKAEADRKAFDPSSQEVFPGMTITKLQEKAAANRTMLNEPGQEVFPGITREELAAKVAADRVIYNAKSAEMLGSFPPPPPAKPESQAPQPESNRMPGKGSQRR